MAMLSVSQHEEGEELPSASDPTDERLGGFTDQERRQLIFKAAVRCFQRHGVRRTTMDDIADEAKVSRQTVYNYFDNKRTLVAEVIFDESRRINARALAKLDLALPADELLVEAEMQLIASALKSSYVDSMLHPDALGVIADLVDRSERVAAVQREYWYPILDTLASRGEIAPDLDFNEAIEWLTFVHYLLVAHPVTYQDDPATARRLLSRWVIPTLLVSTPKRTRSKRLNAV